MNKKLTLDYITQIISKNGDKLLSDKYENRMSRLTIECDKCQDPFETNIIQYRKGGRGSRDAGRSSLTTESDNPRRN